MHTYLSVCRSAWKPNRVTPFIPAGIFGGEVRSVFSFLCIIIVIICEETAYLRKTVRSEPRKPLLKPKLKPKSYFLATVWVSFVGIVLCSIWSKWNDRKESSDIQQWDHGIENTTHERRSEKTKVKKYMSWAGCLQNKRKTTQRTQVLLI